MNATVIYLTKFGNTQKVAEKIGETISAANGSDESVSVIPLEQLKVANLTNIELVVMGSPTHKMNLPESIKSTLDQLPKKTLTGIPVAAFDTSYKMSPFLAKFTAGKKLNRKLRKLGGKPIVPPETFHVTGRKGPLFEGEIERAAHWANDILAILSNHGRAK